MSRVERVFVSYHQLQVRAGVDGGGGNLVLYTVGDGLVHLTGRSELTAMTGPHTGWVEVGVEVLAHPPGPDPGEWEAARLTATWPRHAWRRSPCSVARPVILRRNVFSLMGDLTTGPSDSSLDFVVLTVALCPRLYHLADRAPVSQAVHRLVDIGQS